MKQRDSAPSTPVPRKVGISDVIVATGAQTFKSYGLGSCLAIALYDPEATIGGLAHAMLPTNKSTATIEDLPGKYADTAVRALHRRTIDAGGCRSSLEAKVAGGSDMFEFDSLEDSVGKRNIETAKAELETLGVPLVAEDVGGSHGRTVEFILETGALVIETADDEQEDQTL
ncbi:chemotaxis protein CheD [Halostagnicola larsenii XH-48]|uniref:Probable chemoreceptor glutamine deamidase CheD n=1 Tax=Halostagnicola larsenii XH-48 TaxID=797299 RepID=W0JP18_9EURY|nr:chemotaxis protein CheD [Halostagnicola larsenii]AHF99046.1 chemotaxis protein CheD [Halostagnicola larsenii XH-48]